VTHLRYHAQARYRCAGNVDPHTDLLQRQVAAASDGASADLVAGKARLVDDDDALAKRGFGGDTKQRGGGPRGTTTDDDDVEVSQLNGSRA